MIITTLIEFRGGGGGGGGDIDTRQGWVGNFTPGICQYLPVWKILLKWQIRGGGGGGFEHKTRLGGKFHPRHLPVFTSLENTPQVANTGKYWQIEFFALKYSRNLKQDGLKQYNPTKLVKMLCYYLLKLINLMNKVFLNFNTVEIANK